jgi:hypothetical protein
MAFILEEDIVGSETTLGLIQKLRGGRRRGHGGGRKVDLFCLEGNTKVWLLRRIRTRWW